MRIVWLPKSEGVVVVSERSNFGPFLFQHVSYLSFHMTLAKFVFSGSFITPRTRFQVSAYVSSVYMHLNNLIYDNPKQCFLVDENLRYLGRTNRIRSCNVLRLT